MNKQIRDLFKRAGIREVENIVAAIMQIVAGAADRAERGNTR